MEAYDLLVLAINSLKQVPAPALTHFHLEVEIFLEATELHAHVLVGVEDLLDFEGGVLLVIEVEAHVLSTRAVLFVVFFFVDSVHYKLIIFPLFIHL